MAFNSAEQVTRYLRNRENKVPDLVAVARQLVAGDLSVYLPRKSNVVLEWLFEKLSDPKGSSWRTSESVWGLFNDTWRSLDLDHSSRMRVFAGSDFIAILQLTFGDVSNCDLGIDYSNLFVEIARVLDLLSETVVWARPANDSGVSMISAFFMACIHTLHKDTLVNRSLEELSNALMPVVRPIFTAKRAYKKGVLASRLFVPAMTLLGYPSFNEKLEEIVEQALRLYLSACEEKEMTESLGALSKKKVAGADFNKAAIRLYAMAVSSVSKSRSAQYFKAIVESFPASIGELLKLSIANSVPVSKEQLERIIDESLSQPKIDWQLILYLIKLNSDVVISKIDRIFEMLSPKDEDCVLLARAIVEAYGEHRELPQFFERWGQLMNRSQIWCSEIVSREVEKQLSALSAHQLNLLIEYLVKQFNESPSSDSSRPLKKQKTEKRSQAGGAKNAGILQAISLVKALLSASANLIERVEQNVLQLLAVGEDSLKDEKLWHMKYLILSLGRSFVESGHSTIITQVARVNLSDNDSYDLWVHVLEVMFRIREFMPVEGFDYVVTRMLGLVDESAQYLPRFLTLITRRWLVLANLHFGKQHLTLLSQLYLRDEDQFALLAKNPLFYEQENFVNEMIREIIREFELKTMDTISIAKILNSFPVEVFSRQVRERVLNFIYTMDLQARKAHPEDLLSIRQLLLHLVVRPTYASKIESSLNSLWELVESCYQSQDSTVALNNTTLAIVRTVLQNHIANIANETSRTFVTKLVSKLVKRLASDPQVWVLEIAATVVTEMKDTGLEDLTLRTLTAYVDYLFNSSADTLEELYPLVVSLNLLISHVGADLDKPAREKILTIISGQLDRVCRGISAPVAKNYAAQCFHILCAVQPIDLSGALDLTAKFIFLTTLNRSEELVEPFGEYLSKLSGDIITDILAQLVSETFDLTGVDTSKSVKPAYVEANRVILTHFDKTLLESPEKAFVQMISQSAEHIARFGPKGLLSLLKLLETALREKSWMVSQYGLELIMALVCRIVSPIGPNFEASLQVRDDVYMQICLVVSAILIYHRHRLNGRYHLVMELFQQLLLGLASTSDKAGWLDGPLSVVSAMAYSRLLSNLCEPPTQSVREKAGKNNLTSSSAQAKKLLSKHIYVLMLAYIIYSLRHGYPEAIRNELKTGFYPVFDVLGQDGLKVTNAHLDASTRAFFRPLYEDYKKNGKWKEE
ncbi:hypothetical protein TRVA0_022S01816 [Trichomonascus vanleenenianus]|uniref:ribosome biogenesis protein URB2 n=1 Tax=Trichomonascus vanleenenianus TaxID=2268995 RepID=UPI003ECB2264